MTEVASRPAARERDLQQLVEANLGTMLGARFLASEYSTGPIHGGRIDTLGIDESGAPVVVEYKRGVDASVQLLDCPGRLPVQRPTLGAAYPTRTSPNHETDDGTLGASSPAEAMAQAGIVQEGDPVLIRPARPFDLPSEADEARRVVRELLAATEGVRALHTFGKGMGIAAPQIGIDRSAAVVLPPDHAEAPIVLLNAEVTEASEQQDEQYEGCLSFFSVRGLVPRGLHIVVAHTEPDGTTRLSRFDNGIARLVAHEVDHLHGTLYRERMRAGIEPIPIEEYRGVGHRWTYT